MPFTEPEQHITTLLNGSHTPTFTAEQGQIRQLIPSLKPAPFFLLLGGTELAHDRSHKLVNDVTDDGPPGMCICIYQVFAFLVLGSSQQSVRAAASNITMPSCIVRTNEHLSWACDCAQPTREGNGKIASPRFFLLYQHGWPFIMPPGIV